MILKVRIKMITKMVIMVMVVMVMIGTVVDVVHFCNGCCYILPVMWMQSMISILVLYWFLSG